MTTDEPYGSAKIRALEYKRRKKEALLSRVVKSKKPPPQKKEQVNNSDSWWGYGHPSTLAYRNENKSITPSYHPLKTEDTAMEALHKQNTPPNVSTPKKRTRKPSEVKIQRNRYPAVESLIEIDQLTPSSLIKRDLKQGISEQINGESSSNSDVDVVIGLDMGTSFTKVIISDHSTDTVYPVPFVSTSGINSYLLPTSVKKAKNNVYSLANDHLSHKNLKLAFLKDPNKLENKINMIAYLALVIQSTRAWFFQKHSNVYKNKFILWTLSMGLAAADLENESLLQQYKELSHLAWYAANNTRITQSLIIKLLKENDPKLLNENLEVYITPEIAAQIYGTVNTAGLRNGEGYRFLMVDIGSGTVDAAVFRLITRNGLWEIEPYQATVEMLGVRNLHEYRVDWWIKQLQLNKPKDETKNEFNALSKELADDLDMYEPNDKLPDSFKKYVKGITVLGLDGSNSPDDIFFKKLKIQTQSNTIHNTHKEQLLGKNDIAGMPMFMCGGGSRLKYYNQLRAFLTVAPLGSPWLYCVDQGTLPKPDGLMFEPGREISDLDYDRISVAYGLSKIQAKILDRVPVIEPLPPLVEIKDDGYDFY